MCCITNDIYVSRIIDSRRIPLECHSTHLNRKSFENFVWLLLVRNMVVVTSHCLVHLRMYCHKNFFLRKFMLHVFFLNCFDVVRMQEGRTHFE